MNFKENAKNLIPSILFLVVLIALAWGVQQVFQINSKIEKNFNQTTQNVNAERAKLQTMQQELLGAQENLKKDINSLNEFIKKHNQKTPI